MDIQAIGHWLKKNGANAAAGGSAGDAGNAPTNAFSALVQTMGAKFGTNLGDINNLASKLISNDDMAKAARAEDDAPVRAKDDDKKTDEKPKAAKSKKKDDDQNDAAQSASKDDQNTTKTDANADGASASDAQAAQAAVAAAVEVPMILQTETVAITTPVVQAAAAVEVTTPAEQAAAQAVQAAVDATAQTATQDTGAAKAAVETAQTATATDAPKAVETAQKAVQQVLNTTAAADATEEEVTEMVEAPVAKEATTDKNQAAANRQQVRSAAAQEQSQNLARALGNEDKIQVQVKVAGPRVAATVANEPSSYNIYTGYTAGNQESTANGQVGQVATNALGSKSPAEQVTAPVIPSPNVAPPQAQTSQQGTTQTARAELQVQAVSSTSQSSSFGSQSNAGSEFGSALNNGNSTSSSNSTQSAAQTNAPQRPAPTVHEIVDQIKVSINRASKAGLDRVTIQLKPAELGRIDVKLEMSEDHKVRVTVLADNSDTLSLLKSDSHTLERALNDAGLRTDANNLHFSLREGSDQRANDGQDGQNGARGSAQGDEEDAANDDYAPIYDYGAAARSRGGVDTFA